MINILEKKETKGLIIKIFVSVILSFVVGYYTNWLLGLVLIVLLIIIIISRIEKQREEEIKNLTMYLKRLNHNDYSYDLIDFNEGDLSLLKSEMHKTMYLLKHHNEEMNRQKEFIYTSLSDISHQLKTPITGLQLMLDLLEDDLEPKKHMVLQTERLQSLVEGLLKHIQLEAKSIPMKTETISSQELISKLITMVHTDLTINTEVEDFNFKVDIKWTLEALFNVLNNKLSFANKIISIKAYSNKLYYIIEISDDGEAIEAKDRNHLFERFYKGTNSTSNSVGIGLAISQEIMNLQNGRIRIEDTNTFQFLFTKE